MKKLRYLIGKCFHSRRGAAIELAVMLLVRHRPRLGALVIALLAAPLRAHLKENATFVCSGILAEREEEVKNLLTANGYRLFDRIQKGDWVALAARVN